MTWRSGLRSRAIQAVLFVAVALVFVAFLSSYFSPRQPQTVVLDVGLSGMRFSLALFAIFWIDQLVAKDISSKGILLTLTYPIERSSYMLARFFGVLGLIGLAAALLGLMLWIAVLMGGHNYEQASHLLLGAPYWMTVLGLYMDAVVVAAFTLMMSSVSTVPMLPIASGLAFAIGAKSLGAVLEYFAHGADGDPAILGMAPLFEYIQWIVPDLSRLDWRTWPMYGADLPAGLVFDATFMALGYVMILLALAIRVFSRREFS